MSSRSWTAFASVLVRVAGGVGCFRRGSIAAETLFDGRRQRTRLKSGWVHANVCVSCVFLGLALRGEDGAPHVDLRVVRRTGMNPSASGCASRRSLDFVDTFEVKTASALAGVSLPGRLEEGVPVVVVSLLKLFLMGAASVLA